eukprot:1615392-Amphidinium_carterae.1
MDGPWTDMMHQIWRRYRSYPAPSLGVPGGVPLERDEEAELLRCHWKGVFGAGEDGVEENALLNFVVTLPWDDLV